MNLRNDLYNRGIYFLADSGSFSYLSHCLADGLSQCGFPIHSNISFAEPLVTDFRFDASHHIKPCDAACVVLDLQATYHEYSNRIIEVEPLHERMIVLCMQDNVSDFALAGAMPMLCTHENRFRKVPGCRIPAGFGLSTAMIQAAMGIQQTQARNNAFLRTFRPSLRQDLRACLDLALLPIMGSRFELEDRTSGDGRWSPSYYGLLGSYAGVLAYCGVFAQDLMKNDIFRNRPQLAQFGELVTWDRDTVVARWDSWRFWESLLFGCVTVHLDFERYGFSLPVMPENWKHYIGLDLADLPASVERMHVERERLPEIARAGRQWVLEHYSPVAVARRFVAMLPELFEKGGGC